MEKVATALALLFILFASCCVTTENSKTLILFPNFECSKNVNCAGNKVVGKKGTSFELNYSVPSKYEGWKVKCYCYKFNNVTHPLAGKICGGYGVVKNGKAITKGWEIDFESGNKMEFKCYLEKEEKKELETLIIVESK